MSNPVKWYVGLVERDERRRPPRPRQCAYLAGLFFLTGVAFLVSALAFTIDLFPGAMFVLAGLVQLWRSRRDRARLATEAGRSASRPQI